MSYIDRLDRRLVRHLKLGGVMHEPVGIQITTKIIKEAMANPEIFRLATLFHFSEIDMMILYSGMVTGLKNPLINDPSGFAPCLVATLFLNEPFRLGELMKVIEEAMPKGTNEESRLEIISRSATEVAKGVWMAHANARGVPAFDVIHVGGRTSSEGWGVGGCGCLVIIGFTLAGFFSMACGGALVYWIAVLPCRG
jgi:hypothetical protein